MFSSLMACGVDDPGTAGPGRNLSSVEIEPNGPHCAAGGTATHDGTDDNDNGMLDPDEVATTTYACNHQTLLRLDHLESGGLCPGGGTIVRSGHDNNDNGALEDAEIESSATVCNSDEIYHGDLKTSDFKTSASQERLSHVRVVTGNVKIDFDLPMPSLEMVGGSVDLEVDTLVSLPALQSIAGSLEGPPSVIITGGVITSLDRRVQLDVPALHDVGGNISMTSWKPDGRFSAPALTAVDGEIDLQGQYTTLDLHLLSTVGKDFEVHTQADKLALPSLSRAGGAVTIGGTFKSLELDTLATATSFTLLAPNLTALTLPTLKTSPLIRIGNCGATTVRLPSLTSLTSLYLYQMPQLQTFEMPQVTALENLTLRNMAMTSLEMFSSLQAVKKLSLDKNAQLVDLKGLEQLTSMTSLSLTENEKLASLAGLEQLAKLSGDLTIKNNAALASLAGLSGLTNVSGTIAIADNTALPQADIDAFLKRLGR